MKVDEKVTVGIVNNAPKYILWRGRNYKVTKIGLHHYFNEGKVLYHIFSVLCDTIFMRLKMDSLHLEWRLEETESAT